MGWSRGFFLLGGWGGGGGRRVRGSCTVVTVCQLMFMLRVFVTNCYKD